MTFLNVSSSPSHLSPSTSRSSSPITYTTPTGSNSKSYSCDDTHDSIDYALEYSRERLRLKQLAQQPGLRGSLSRLIDSLIPWCVIVLSGIAIGILAASIAIVTNYLQDVRYGFCSSTWYLGKRQCCVGFEGEVCFEWRAHATGVESVVARSLARYATYIALGVLFATTSSYLVNVYAKQAFHEGIIELKAIQGGLVLRSFLSSSTLLIKSLSLPLAVGSGLSLGSEGPLVAVASCVGDLMLRPFSVLRGNQAKRREILSSASAAGISVAFGAPLGGVLFALEEISTFPGATLWSSFICAVVAAVTLQYVDPYNSGRLVLFELQSSTPQIWKAFELIPFVGLGVIGGVFGFVFIRMNKEWELFRRSSGLKEYPISEVCALSFFTAVVAYLCAFSRIPTSELVSLLFTDCSATATEPSYGLCDSNAVLSTVFLLVVTALLKMVLTALVFGASLPAGVFLPSLAIGGLVGRAVGIVLSNVQRAHPDWLLFASACPADGNCISPSVFAVIGAASFLAGMTRMTISLTVILFELTGAVDLVLQIMISVLVAKFTADYLSLGIYETWMNLRSYPFLSNKTEYSRDVRVKEIMTPVDDLTCLRNEGMTIESLESILASEGYRGFPIIRSTLDPTLLGYISRAELSTALHAARLSLDTSPSTPCYFSSHPKARGSPIGGYSAQQHLSAHETFDIKSPGFEQAEFELFSVDNDESTRVEGDKKVQNEREIAWVNLKPWVDQTPMHVNLEMAVEIVVEMFSRLGLRYILLTRQGRLQGILTKMDLHFHLQSKDNGMPQPQTRSKSTSPLR